MTKEPKGSLIGDILTALLWLGISALLLYGLAVGS